MPAGYLNGTSGTIIVPEIVRAMNLAVQHAFQRNEQFSTGAETSEFQVTSPIVGTVDLSNAKDISGNALPNTVVNDKGGVLIPQRSNLMVTTGFVLPGFDGRLRAFRVFKPAADSSSTSGSKFVADGTKLWVATAPAAASRNLYTSLPDGSMVAFTAANAAQLAPHMNMTAADAAALIAYVRDLPIGAPVDSTPAILNPPSLDPPPDSDYSAFVADNKDRRSLVFVGTNRGILEAIDARLGVEVWGLIPYNLLPKLKTLLDGQSVGSFDYFVDGSPKLADVKIANVWKTYLFFGQGPGGTFYQALDVTLDGMSGAVMPADDSIANVLAYFASATRIPLQWSFPSYANFDPAISTALMPYGDLKSSASAAELSVGQTWSDPSVGQIQSPVSPYVLLVGSGFLPKSVQAQSNRNNTAAGSSFYMVKVEDGSVLASTDVGNDNKGELVDNNCWTNGDCSRMKNALQSDPVASGPQGSRYISAAYIADLDGRIWRFDIGLNASSVPTFLGAPVKLYDDASSQPIFNSMAVIDIGGGTQRYLFAGTGSDLLPSTGVSMQYKLIGILDQGSGGQVTFTRLLTKVDNVGSEEKVTAYPAVAGDVVFFTTTTFKAGLVCALPDANLYALTFVGGPAYDNTGDNTVTAADTPLVRTITGTRATAPFVVDQHLVFGAGDTLQLFGDPQDFNNGVGQAGVRILSWREVR
jgi:Tfp pilus tip-associated adhesin PilY1